MNFRRPRLAVLALILCGACQAVLGQSTMTLADEKGAMLTFSDQGTGWQWTRLISPANPEGWTLEEGEVKFAVGEGLDVLAGGWESVPGAPATLAFERDAPASGLRVRRVFSFGPAPNVVRIETWIRSVDVAKLVQRIALLTLRVDGESFRTTGPAPDSFPVFGERLFAGVEDLCAESRAEQDQVRLWQTPDLSVGTDWQFVAAAVVGWHPPRAAVFLPGESRTRDAFLQYLDTIRLRPEGINLHSDTWWTLPMPFTEADVLADIAALRTGFFERTGMFFDTYALDLGWSDPQSLWRVDERNFPAGLQAIAGRLAGLNCRMGMWVSPSSGYPGGLDNRWLDAQGYEMTPVSDEGDKVACFALGGRYQREFTEAIVGYAKDYGLGHVIFDGLVRYCHEPGHRHATGTGSNYAIAAGFRDVMDRLRQVNPKMVLEPLSCGHPPSPWWNRHTPFLLGPAGDDVPFGRVPCPDWTESLVSARDIAYRATQEKWLVRTQALETFDIIMQSPGTFQNMAVMAAGRGRWFMSANIRPELMQPADWDFLAGLVRWQRANQRYLVDARQIGGQPEKREAYGYMFHHADRDLYCIRNPWMEARAIKLPTVVAGARDLRTIYPRRASVARLQPGEGETTVVLGPYETQFLETVAVADDSELPVAPEAAPVAVVTAQNPEVFPGDATQGERGFYYYWTGTITVPDVAGAELCLLVEGPPEVAGAQAFSWVDGADSRMTRNGSAGQFGAAVDASPDNWAWFQIPLTPGEHEFGFVLNVPLEKAAIGVYLRGSTVGSPGTELEFAL